MCVGHRHRLVVPLAAAGLCQHVLLIEECRRARPGLVVAARNTIAIGERVIAARRDLVVVGIVGHRYEDLVA